METPASTRMITRSQSASLLKKSKMQEEREAKGHPLFDITNDSPITSLITKGTPTKHNASSIKSGGTGKKTPLSGESLLRCQVHILLQKEDEKDGGCVRMADRVLLSPAEKEDQLFQMLVFVDTPDKSELTDIGSINSSSVTIMDTSEAPDTVGLSDDDCSSVWSLQVNANSEKEDLDEEIKGETEESEELDLYHDHQEEDEEEEFLYDVCKGLNGMLIEEENESRKCAKLPLFRGRHTKFPYNSEDEIEEQVIVLRGLPAPEGTHVRFSYENDE